MVKQIHVAESIERLNQLAEVNTVKLKKNTALQLSKSAKLVLDRAVLSNKDGDEENAYIFYMKYFNLVSIMQAKKDFNDAKKNLGTSKEVFGRMDILEKLKKSLLIRYAEKQANYDALHQKTVNYENEVAKSIKPPSIFIFCNDLYKRMESRSEAILLMDCRASIEFEASKIIHDKLINIPGDIISNGKSASILTRDIDPVWRKLWDIRGSMDLIVLIDEDTSESQPPDQMKPIRILRDILLKWDPSTQYKNILLLEGGFSNFLIYYPMKTTNPKYKPIRANEPTVSVGDIEYPSLDGIKMKPKEPKKEYVSSIPRIDRTSKPQPHMNPVLFARDQEKKYDLVLEKEREALNIGNELTNVVNAPVAQTDEERSEWFGKQNELEYKLIQKEHELNETLNIISSEHEVAEITDQLESLNHEHNPEVSAIVARIQAKKNEHNENKKRLKDVEQAIGTKRNQLRQQEKRQLEMKEEEEELIRPKQPSFDRSVKPTLDRIASFPEYDRDFSPVSGTYGDIGATGLKNLGNTCYMNSIIQCLLNTETFREYLRTDGYRKHINRRSQTQGLVTLELAELCKAVWAGKYKSVAARDFRSIVGKEHKIFSSYDQQDSHEFLVILIDMLHSELQFSDGNHEMDKSKPSEVAWREFLKNMQSIIQVLFFGQIRSTVKCRTCGFESATYEGFSHLSLELPQDNRECSLYDCLDLYFNGEIIEGWTCPKCNQNRDAIKKLDISKMPPVLVIHLKRFYASLDSSNTYIKKPNYVHFPSQKFDVLDYITPSLKSRNARSTYNLYAVSNHYGTMNRGHYTAYCKNSKSQSWYKYDDNYVTQINEHEVDSSAGYILFYSQT